MEGFRKVAYNIRTAFYIVTCEKMRNVVRDLYERIKEGDGQKILNSYLVFLQNCEILKRELEDFGKKPILGIDIEEKINEIKEKFGMKKKEGGMKNDAFCSGCSIF